MVRPSGERSKPSSVPSCTRMEIVSVALTRGACAAAVGTPVAALFGPTREYETAPLPRAGARTEVLTHQVWCRPCMLRECPIDHRCMTRISPERVYTAVDTLIAGVAR